MVKRLLVLVITLAVIIGGAYYFFGMHDKSSTNQLELNQLDTKAHKLYQALQGANFVEQGQKNAPRSMYVIFDPNCVFCHALFAASQQQINAGELTIRWVPIGIIKRSSSLKVMAILGAKSPLSALKQNEESFNYSQEEGGISPVTNPTNDEVDRFNHNMTILKGLINSVPVVVYKNVQNQIRISGGTLLPLQASEIALASNEKTVAHFLQSVGKSW